MSPDRSITIGVFTIEEFYWHGKMVVYINNFHVGETYEEAVKRMKAKTRLSESRKERKGATI